MATDPFNCDGCHTGDWAGFDHFCDALDVGDGEYGQAFAAWLGGTTEWDGEYGKVERHEARMRELRR